MAVEKYLAGKLAIVTGSGKLTGIGYAVATALAQQGADIVLHYNTNGAAAELGAQKLRELGVQAATVQADASLSSFGTDVVHATQAAFPGRAIDIVVNNAASIEIAPSVSEAMIESFDRIFHANVRAPFALMQAVVPHLAAPGARLINIGSLAGATGSRFSTFYAASKAAVHNLARSFAEELGPKGITVNTVAPGPVATDMVPSEEHPLMQKYRAGQSVKRNGTPEEIATAVLFVAHPNSSFYTGQVLAVDGGIAF